ncbi:hypothetical protein AOY20_01575 [Acinetobacter equi]|uniref:DUF6708 domain-containing protein n=2 Tax=Acinetobacter equi TaxID=1324350 RepID=A0A0N9W008_9GAMM|nr:hypothetical protein AOY20_01575 [Acinetobacter equi]
MFLLFCLSVYLYFIYEVICKFINDGYEFDFFFIFIFILYFFVTIVFYNKFVFKEFKKYEYKSFYYLPIRFNRKNKKVYVFTKDGEEKIYDWDELFFYIATVDWLYGIKKVELRAAKVDADDNIEFSFSLNSPTPFAEDTKQCLSYWEFIRHYMEDGPQDFYIDANSLESFNEIQLCFCNDIDQKLESYEMSKLRLFYNYKPLGIAELTLVAPIFYPWLWVRRYLMKYQAKIPYWSAEVNEACKVEENDHYVVDSSINKYFEIRLFPSRMAVRKEYLKND